MVVDTPYKKHTKDTAIKNTFVEDTNRVESLAASNLKISKDNLGLDNRNFSVRELTNCLRTQLDILKNNIYSEDKLDYLLKLYNERSSSDYKSIGKEVETILGIHYEYLTAKLGEKSLKCEFKKEDNQKSFPD